MSSSLMGPTEAGRILNFRSRDEAMTFEEQVRALRTVASLREEFAVVVSRDCGREFETVCDSDGITWMGPGEVQDFLEFCRGKSKRAGEQLVYQVASRMVSVGSTWNQKTPIVGDC